MMYQLGSRSLKNLVGVHPALAFAVTEAIKITQQDFTVFDGVRTPEKQLRLVQKGMSKSTNSYHLYGLAVDLVPYTSIGPVWTEELFPPIIDAMNTVIEKYNLPIQNGFQEWGWDMPHWQLTGMRSEYDIRKILK